MLHWFLLHIKLNVPLYLNKRISNKSSVIETSASYVFVEHFLPWVQNLTIWMATHFSVATFLHSICAMANNATTTVKANDKLVDIDFSGRECVVPTVIFA